MKIYKVQYNKAFLKDLEKIPKPYQKKIMQRVEQLSVNPRPEECKILKGNAKPLLYRIRCGDYRVIYTIEDGILLVVIIEMGHRREIYR